jgi:hypothetical protein
MLYKFKSKAAGDVIMLQPNGDELLRILGREPAPKGILEVAQMPAALAALEAALARAEQPNDDDAADSNKPRAVGLKQRVWPMVELIRRSLAAQVPVVWGV